MALFGNGGTLELSREWPKPMALRPGAIGYGLSPIRIEFGNQDYWTGDQIIFACASGLPFDQNGDGYADAPDGHGIYRGGQWATGPSRAWYEGAETDNSPFYERFPAYLTTQDSDNLTTQAGDQFFVFTGQDQGKFFYNRIADTGLSTQISAYIHIDALDRIRLFNTEIAAHNLDVTAEIIPLNVSIDNFVIARYSANATYTNAVAAAANSIKPLLLPSTSQPLEDVITVPAGFAVISDDPEQRGWLVQCQLEEWALDIDASGLDMTAIGQTFGEQTKALVRGAGALQFVVDREVQAGEQDATTLLRLVLLTQNSCKSSAKFHLYKNRTPVSPQVGTTAYYSCDLLLTNSRINVKAGDLITGSSDFVVTGEIGLRFLP